MKEKTEERIAMTLAVLMIIVIIVVPATGFYYWFKYWNDNTSSLPEWNGIKPTVDWVWEGNKDE